MGRDFENTNPYGGWLQGLVQPFATLAFDGTCYWLAVPELRDRTAKIRLFREWLTTEIAAARTEATAAAFVPPEG